MNVSGEPVRNVRTLQALEISAFHGKGIEGDPARITTTYWVLDGDEWKCVGNDDKYTKRLR